MNERPQSTPVDVDFASLGLQAQLVAGLTELGYEAPTPIQAAAIPDMLTGQDMLCQAATGTGKTAAFALPMLSARAGKSQGKKPTALVLAPTRELCMQVAEAVHRYGRPFSVRTLPVYGGQPIGRQISALKRGVDIVVATPGRALDLLERGNLDLSEVSTVVLDEADEMLDMGFADDLDAILTRAPADRQTVMFSATMPKRILKIANTHLKDPLRIEIAREVLPEGERPQIKQTAYVVARRNKTAALGRILDVESPTATLVFCRTRAEVDQLTETLNGYGYRAEGLHGGMNQAQRDRVMNRLRNGKAELLVATDVAARGLDIDHLTHVVNFDVPAAPESYVHRIGRVGRGGREGTAITLVEPREQRLLRSIERTMKQDIPLAKIPTSAELRELRLEATRAKIASACMDEDLGEYRATLQSLVAEFGPDDVALAAVKLAHLASTGESNEGEIPDLEFASDGGRPGAKSRGKDAGGYKGRDRGDRDRGDARGKKGDWGRDGEKRSGGGRPAHGRARLFLAAGRDEGIRPQDIVGSIANESRLEGSEIGPIRISDRFSTVEVPEGSADGVIAALSATRIKGKKVKVRRDRY